MTYGYDSAPTSKLFRESLIRLMIMLTQPADHEDYKNIYITSLGLQGLVNFVTVQIDNRFGKNIQREVSMGRLNDH